MVDKKKIINGNNVKPGDFLIGLPSSGVHSNGFSLIRKVFNVDSRNILTYYDELGKTLGEELLTPTKIYVSALTKLASKVTVRAVSHITGGGFYENIPRMLPDGVRAMIELATFPKPIIFDMLQNAGSISTRDMYNTFNMGIGLVIAVDRDEADAALRALNEAGETPYLIGECVHGEKGIELW